MMKRLIGMVALLAVMLAFGPGSAWAGGKKEDREMKTALLLVAFGTNAAPARTALAALEADAQARFPGREIRWAYSAQTIRHRMEKEGRPAASPAGALARLAEEGYGRVAVQSLHVIPGYEFNDLMAVAKAMAGLPKGLQRVSVGLPLLARPEDIPGLAQAILEVAAAERNKDEALVLVGHGTSHPAGAFYPALSYALKRLDGSAWVGVVDGYPGLDLVREDLVQRRIKRAWLLPLMTVAGEHVRRDLAGQEEDSWVSTLGRAGIEARVVVKGLAESAQMRAVWLDHLAATVAEVEK